MLVFLFSSAWDTAVFGPGLDSYALPAGESRSRVIYHDHEVVVKYCWQRMEAVGVRK